MQNNIHPAELRSGHKIPVLRGTSAVLPDLDFETYSEAGFVWEPSENKWICLPRAKQGKKGLTVVGAAVYAKHPTTEVLSLYYNLKDGSPRQHWKPGMPPPLALFALVQSGGLLEAHNSTFEHWIWNYVCVPKYGWPPLPQRQLRCSMAKARYNGYPGKLENLGDCLDLDVKKDAEGKRVLDLFSVPRNPTKADGRLRIRPQDAPADAEILYDYNDTDIVAESEASARLPDLEGEELEFWLLDQDINHRGVQVNMRAILAACDIIDQALDVNDRELAQLTSGHVERASQLDRMSQWLEKYWGVRTPDGLAQDFLDGLLEQDLPAPARRALEIRQAVGSASVKKAFSIRNQMTEDGRLHDLFNYHGARTGRPTGEGPQPTNLPKAGPKVTKCTCGRYHGAKAAHCPWCGLPSHPMPKIEPWSWRAAKDAIELIYFGSYFLLNTYFDDAMLTISGCMRSFFTSKQGYELICSDFSAIEGVVIAALSGEQWRLDVYRTHGKMYETAASKMFGIPFENFAAYAEANNEAHHPARDKGKRGELGLGFGGWINAWRNISKDPSETDDVIKNYILAWRDASPAVIEFWGGQGRGAPWSKSYREEYFGLEGAAVQAVLNPGQEFRYRDTSYIVEDDVLFCYLISGRPIKYHRPRVKATQRKEGWAKQWQLSYEGWNSNPAAGPLGWSTMYLYGGKLAENVVQATARDIQRHAMLSLAKAGYPIVLHVYDEIVCEVPEGYGNVEEFERIMMTLPDWCKGWPIKAAKGWIGKDYRKD